MKTFSYPEHYKPILDEKETEHAIILFKNFFQTSLSTELNLTRVTAPLFVKSGTGINDDLNGIERPVRFPIKSLGDKNLEIVQSLAKWKRLKVTSMNLERGFGIYTDMNAVRPDEDLDAIHSIYVDQWDWEMAIDEADRNVEFLQSVVKKIYRCIKRSEFLIYDNYPKIKPRLPEEIKFLFTEDLEKEYPDLTPKEREYKAAKKYGAVFIIGIGAKLANGKPHDGRAPDYDDWITETGNGHRGLNGDIIVWNDVLKQQFELSSMGIRVSPASLKAQLKERGEDRRKSLMFHSRLLKGELKQTIGGGIGQSRLCMLLFKKAHIGETHASIWPDKMIADCKKHGISFL